MYLIDTDNALGSKFGDIDDGFGLVAALLSDLPITAISVVAGNTNECSAFDNTRTLVELCGSKLPVLRSEEIIRYPIPNGSHAIALGPLTNIAKLIKTTPQVVQEITIVGGNSVSSGKYPPYWPFEFNLTKDREAALKVLCSDVPVTIIPLNVAKCFQISFDQIRKLRGKVGHYLQRHSRRWFWRAKILKWKDTVPLWDLVAVLYTIEPDLFDTRNVKAKIHDNTWIEFDVGERELKIVHSFDSGLLWERFERLVAGTG